MAVRRAPRKLSVALLGAGRMGMALATGWTGEAGRALVSRLSVFEPDPSPALRTLAQSGRVDLNPSCKPADVLVLAVKPQVFASTVAFARACVGPRTLVVSIMAGVTLARLSEQFSSGRVVRAMPNTPGSVGAGVTGFSPGAGCEADDLAMVSRLLAPLGNLVGPLAEEAMDWVTAVSGSGPAYVFLLAEALEAAGRKLGLDAETAAKLARQTVVGAARLLAEPGADPVELRKAVTSPNGTTAAALDVLMAEPGLPDLLRRAVQAAARRSAELSRDS